jgi:hypothetical protein
VNSDESRASAWKENECLDFKEIVEQKAQRDHPWDFGKNVNDTAAGNGNVTIYFYIFVYIFVR